MLSAASSSPRLDPNGVGGEGTVDRVQRFGDAAGGRARPASRDADGVAGARLLIAASKIDATAVVTLYPKP
jgi:hypothetical protein